MQETRFRTEVSPRSTTVLACLGHLVLLADTVFFVAALIDAQLMYADMFESHCSLAIPLVAVQVIVTVGYGFRCAISAGLILFKVVNMYEFVARKRPFPRLGAVYAPFMSMLLLSVIVYDYRHCTELSTLIPVTFAIDVIAIYILLLIVLLTLWFTVVLYEMVTKKKRSRCLGKAIKVVSWGCIGFGGTMGIVIMIEQIRMSKMTLFLVFDTYSFFAVFVGNVLRGGEKLLQLLERRQP